MTGCGRNGKSKLIELLSKTFGEYFGSVQSQMFTRPRPDANSPDPGLLICNDIPECDDIDNAFSKRLRCINFPTEFVDNPKNENQYKYKFKL